VVRIYFLKLVGVYVAGWFVYLALLWFYYRLEKRLLGGHKNNRNYFKENANMCHYSWAAVIVVLAGIIKIFLQKLINYMAERV